MKRKLITSIISLIMLLVGLTGITYAVWDSLTTSLNNGVNPIDVGEGATITVTPNPDTYGTLIPAGAVQGTNDVYEIVITYNVNLSKALKNDQPFTVTVSNKAIGGDATLGNLIHIAVVNASTINSTVIPVTVTVTLTEPADQAGYDALMAVTKTNPAVTFDLTFKAE